MLTEQEKKLLAQAETMAERNSGGGLEKYLTNEAREQVKSDPARTAWAIHFFEKLSQEQEVDSRLEMGLLEEAHLMADAAVAYDRFGPAAFDREKYLTDRKLGEEFTQLLHRYRMRLNDPSIKTIVLRMAHELCAA